VTVIPVNAIDAVHELVDPAIRALLDRLDPHTRLVAGYHLGYWDATGAPGGGPGKGLRPALSLLSARAAGAGAEAGIPAAAAVELVHNFSLLHDDVMDQDTQRRHRATAWTVFGQGAAILAGDALLALANEAVATAAGPGSCQAVRLLNVEVRNLVAGQVADLSFERRGEVTLDECLAMVGDKTGALISCACALGAVLCDAPAGLVTALSGYGRHLGLAFQLVDDLLGIWGRPEVTGKPVLADLRARKKSVPVVRAATSGSAAGDAFRNLYALTRDLTVGELELAALLIEESGAREWTRRRAATEVDQALAALATAEMPDDVREELAGLARFTIARDH
jgi:geranylgeranyl diphosphate synthase type I